MSWIIKNRFLIATLVVAMIIGGEVLACVFSSPSDPGMRTVQKIANEEIKIGDDHLTVQKVLDKHGIDYHYSTRTIFSIFRNTGGDWIVRESTSVDFQFDEADKLRNVEMRKLFTGL
jgi:hypothetical protein